MESMLVPLSHIYVITHRMLGPSDVPFVSGIASSLALQFLNTQLYDTFVIIVHCGIDSMSVICFDIVVSCRLRLPHSAHLSSLWCSVLDERLWCEVPCFAARLFVLCRIRQIFSYWMEWSFTRAASGDSDSMQEDFSYWCFPTLSQYFALSVRRLYEMPPLDGCLFSSPLQQVGPSRRVKS